MRETIREIDIESKATMALPALLEEAAPMSDRSRDSSTPIW